MSLVMVSYDKEIVYGYDVMSYDFILLGHKLQHTQSNKNYTLSITEKYL